MLDQVLCGVPRVTNENVLVGYETADDAGVYRIGMHQALVQTVDFVTPIVDDPYTFGAIAAANSLSDVYAMGGVPVSALTLVAFPAKEDPSVLQTILKGGAEKMREAKCAILGGHSINDEEIKFGYAVTGIVHPDRIWKNSGARPGDHLIFTKQLGTGIISTALKRGIAAPSHIDAAISSMLTLNRYAAEKLQVCEVHGCTDITGFGFLGHARELARASKVSLEIDSSSIGRLPGAVGYAGQGAFPGGLRNNWEFVSPDVQIRGGVSPRILDLLCDPQTSGGLLVSLPDASASRFISHFASARRVGRVTPRQGKSIILK